MFVRCVRGLREEGRADGRWDDLCFAHAPLGEGLDQGLVASAAAVLVGVLVHRATHGILDELGGWPVREALAEVDGPRLAGKRGELMGEKGRGTEGDEGRTDVRGCGVNAGLLRGRRGPAWACTPLSSPGSRRAGGRRGLSRVIARSVTGYENSPGEDPLTTPQSGECRVSSGAREPRPAPSLLRTSCHTVSAPNLSRRRARLTADMATRRMRGKGAAVERPVVVCGPDAGSDAHGTLWTG
jgi:hypothetical protein